MFPARSTTKVLIHHENGFALVFWKVEWMFALELLAIVFKDVHPEPFECDTLEEPGRNDPICIKIIPG
jgi:hypothetical protein